MPHSHLGIKDIWDSPECQLWRGEAKLDTGTRGHWTGTQRIRLVCETGKAGHAACMLPAGHTLRSASRSYRMMRGAFCHPATHRSSTPNPVGCRGLRLLPAACSCLGWCLGWQILGWQSLGWQSLGWATSGGPLSVSRCRQPLQPH